MPGRTIWKKFKQIFLHNILHVEDTPERIALGAALGMLVAWTPTVGVQMLIAIALAAVVRGNKAATIPPVWLTNPITVLPVYWFNYKLGNLLLTGTWRTDLSVKTKITDLAGLTLSLRMFTASYWSELLSLLVDIGWPLWIGGTIMGLLWAVLTFVVIRRMIFRHRAKRLTVCAEEILVPRSDESISERSMVSEKQHTAA